MNPVSQTAMTVGTFAVRLILPSVSRLLEVELNVKGGDSSLGLKMFYERARNANLSGLVIGFATCFYALSQSSYLVEAVNYSAILSIAFMLLLVLAYQSGRRFLVGALWSGFLSSGTLALQETRPLMQAILAWQFLGVLELVLLLVGGILITRS